MKAEKLETVKRFFTKDRTVSALVVMGLLGVLLLALPGMFDGKSAKSSTASVAEKEDYSVRLEKGLKKVVSAITGEEEPTVLVTLESDGELKYAADEKASSDGKSTSHVIIKDAGGGQTGLELTELRPEVKGVVIVSIYAGDPVIREKLSIAAKTALGVSSTRVCVTGPG